MTAVSVSAVANLLQFTYTYLNVLNLIVSDIDTLWYFARCSFDHRHLLLLSKHFYSQGKHFIRIFSHRSVWVFFFVYYYFLCNHHDLAKASIPVAASPQKCWLPPTGQEKWQQVCLLTRSLHHESRSFPLTLETDHLDFFHRRI